MIAAWWADSSGLFLIRFFHQSHNTVHFGGLFTLKQWIFSSLKHDPVPVKNPPKRIALWDRENSQFQFPIDFILGQKGGLFCPQSTGSSSLAMPPGNFSSKEKWRMNRNNFEVLDPVYESIV